MKNNSIPKPKFKVGDRVSYWSDEYIIKQVDLYDDEFYKYIIEPLDQIEADEDDLEIL